MASKSNRYREIDFFRAIAIIMVVAFHYFTLWTPPLHQVNLYPYGATFADITLFKYGFLGVDFFFIISGFVIALTLESSSNFWQFMVRRAARLLPAMIVCSTLTLFVMTMVFSIDAFKQSATLWNLLPSWTFSEPYLWSKFFPVTGHIDGAYWTLVVEAKFYVWAALIYFMLNRDFVNSFFVFSIISGLLYALQHYTQIALINKISLHLLFGQHVFLFMAGILFLYLYRNINLLPKMAPLLVACFLLDLTVTTVGYEYGLKSLLISTFMKALFFLAFLVVCKGWKLPANRGTDGVVLIGLASYPLYLLHQKIGVGMLSLGVGLENSFLIFALFIGVCASLVAGSIWLFNYVEQPGKRAILSLVYGPKPRPVSG